jgi:hypothetical protein
MMDTNTAETMCVDEIFNDSYERCLKNSDFIDSFFTTFVESCEVVAQTLSGTDTTRQIGSVEAPLYKIMALRTLQPKDAVAHFRRICANHAQQDGGPVYYDLWKKCLLSTVAKCDDQYDADVEAAWTEVLSGGINIMKSLG